MQKTPAFHSPANISLGCLQIAPLFAPLSYRNFASDFFERRHHITRGSGLSTLLTSSDLAAAANVWQFKVAVDHSQARLLKPDSFAHDDAWESGALLDDNAIKRALRRNRTVVTHNVELYHRPIGLLSLAAGKPPRLSRPAGLAQAHRQIIPRRIKPDTL